MLDERMAQNGPQDTEFDGRTLSQVMQAVEREYICSVLNAAGGNQAQAAKLAGLTYQTFNRKMNALNLRVTYHAG